MLLLPTVDDKKCCEAPTLFFSELGNLHDAKISSIEWDLKQHEIAISIDDLYSNFVDLAEYVGLKPVRLILTGVSGLEVNVASDQFPLRIMDFEVEEVCPGTKVQVAITLDPSGVMRMACKSISCQPV